MSERYNQYIEELANTVNTETNKLSKTDNYTIDPATILAIVTILLKIVELISKWYISKEKPFKLNFLQRRILRKITSKEIQDPKTALYVYTSTLDLVYNLSEGEREKLLNLYKGV